MVLPVVSTVFAAAAIAAPAEVWHDMPNGLEMHQDCIHQHDQGFRVLASGAVRLDNGTTIEYGPCPHKPRAR